METDTGYRKIILTLSIGLMISLLTGLAPRLGITTEMLTVATVGLTSLAGVGVGANLVSRYMNKQTHSRRKTDE